MFSLFPQRKVLGSSFPKKDSDRKFAVLLYFQILISFLLLLATGPTNVSHTHAHLQNNPIARQSREFSLSAATFKRRVHSRTVQQILYGEACRSREKVSGCDFDQRWLARVGNMQWIGADTSERRVSVQLISPCSLLENIFSSPKSALQFIKGNGKLLQSVSWLVC